MPKRTGNSSVNSSIRQNTTATNEGFQQLLDLQSLSNDHLESIRELMANSLLTQKDDNVKNKSIEKENARQQKELENTTTVLKESLKIQQQLLASQNAASIAIATTIKTFKSFGDKFQDFKANMRDNFSSISKALLSTKIVKPGSMVDKLLGVSKRVARDDFVDRQKLLGSTKSKSELREDYKKASGKMDKAGEYIGWLAKEKQVYGFTFSGKWYDIGSIESLEEARAHFLKN